MMKYKFTDVLKMTVTERKIVDQREESRLILALVIAMSNLRRAENAKSEGESIVHRMTDRTVSDTGSSYHSGQKE